MKKQEKFSTRVVFGLCDGEPIAFLLDVPANEGGVMAYMHIGQHGEASLDFYHTAKLAKPEQYDELWKELESIGYELKNITGWLMPYET